MVSNRTVDLYALIHPHPDQLEWRRQAACNDKDPNLWFPNQGSRAHKAINICRQCPVQTQCLNDALQLTNREDEHGIRGGYGVQARRHLRRQHRP